MSAANTSFDRINAALENAGRFGRQYGAWTLYCCPTHDDSNASLGVVYNAAKQRSKVVCFTGGCDDREILAAIGLGVADLYDDPRGPTPRRDTSAIRVHPTPSPVVRTPRDDSLGPQTGPPQIAARYYYRLPDGSAAGRVTRAYIPHERGTKRVFWQNHWVGNAWARGGFPALVYHLPDVISAIRDGRTIYLVEGEKDADKAARAGLIATCNAMGASKFRREHADQLAGARQVIIVADRDDAGRLHAAAVADLLLGRVGAVQIVEAAAGKDLSDHLAAGLKASDLVPSTLSSQRQTAERHLPAHPLAKEGPPAMPEIPVTVYTKPDCVQCAATKRTLDRLAVEYTEVDVTADADARRWLLDLGYTTAPVVVAGDRHFQGHRPDKLAALAESTADNEPAWRIESGVITLPALNQRPAEDSWRMQDGVIVAADPAPRPPTPARPASRAGRPPPSVARAAQVRHR